MKSILWFCGYKISFFKFLFYLVIWFYVNFMYMYDRSLVLIVK